MDDEVRWYFSLNGINTATEKVFEANEDTGQTVDTCIDIPEGKYMLYLDFKSENPPYKNSLWHLPRPGLVGTRPYLFKHLIGQQTKLEIKYIKTGLDEGTGPIVETDKFGETIPIGLYQKVSGSQRWSADISMKIEGKIYPLKYWLSGEMRKIELIRSQTEGDGHSSS